MARTKHGTHSASAGAVRIRTVAKPRRACQKTWIGCREEFSIKLAAETCFVELAGLVDGEPVQLLAHRSGARYRNLTVLMQSEASLPLRLALVGMSGAGKTFWTKKLAAEGWTAICCDDRIEQKLASRLAAGAYSGINGVAAWVGWPDGAKYAERGGRELEEGT